ncbi:MAG TPA: TonB-dependent receptor, partial [Solibacterales bacterium]|nr:TonB-dependent receptor [Bryobacterales bacterium]
ESVTVTEEIPLIENATASTGQVIDRQKLIDLPNLGRNPFMMSRIAQNVTPVGNPAYNRMQDQSGSSQITIAGGPVRGNNYLLDGIPITDAANRAIIIPSIEAVEEVKIQGSTYDAEMARTGGGMFNTFMKSGGNEYHGSLFGYMRQTEWLANTFFNNRAGLPRSEQPFRNYGGSLGGAVKIPKVYNGKNRTFFWIAFEGYRDTQANSTEFATPTALERTGDFSRTLSRAGALQTIFDPSTTRSDGAGGFLRDPFPGNVIPTTRIDRVGRSIANTFAAPTRAARFFGDPNVSVATTLPSVADQYTAKLDHQMTSWWRASLSYLRYNSLEPGDDWFKDSISSPAQWLLDRKVDSTQVNNLITVDPTTVVNIRYGFNRFPNYSYQRSLGYNPADLGFSNAFVRDIPSFTFPNIAMENLYSLGTNSNSFNVHHSKNLLGSVSKYIGRHSLKAGADFRRIAVDGVDNDNSSGQFTFNDAFTRATPVRATAGTGADMASLLLGAPASGYGFVPTKLFNYANYYAIYFHDDIRLTSRLTVNLGLRWERETGMSERNNALIVGFNRDAVNPLSTAANFINRGAVMYAGVNGNQTFVGNPVMNKISPRLGAAFQLNSKTTIRGGYGIYWAPQLARTGVYTPEGYTARTEYVGSFDGNATPAGVLSNPFPTGLNRPVGNSFGDLTGVGRALTLYDQFARSPRVQQFSLDVQRELPGGIALTLGYVGSRTADLTSGAATININQLETRHLALGSALNQTVANPFFGNGGTGVIAGRNITRAQLLSPFPAFGAVNLIFSGFPRARYDSAVVKAQKRFASGFSFLTTWTWSANFDNASGGPANNLNGGNVGPQNVYDLEAEYSLANINAPHRWSTAFTYELPFGRGKAMLGSNKLMDYFVGGWSINAISIYQSGFPLQIRQNANLNSVIGASSQRPNATGLSPATEGSLSQRIDSYINPAAFSQAPQFTFGNLGRTLSLRGPGQANWDLSVFKTVNVMERFKVQFRAEALNAFNTPLFRSPNTAWGNSQFGRITSQANFPRMIQLGARFFF